MLLRGPIFSGNAGMLGGAFSPESLSPALWLEADDLTTLFKEIAGTTPVSAHNDTVGLWQDKSGAAFHLSATADDTSRPAWQTDGTLDWVNFNGSNDVLRRTASLGMDAGAWSVFVAVRANPAVAMFLLSESSSSTNVPVYAPLVSNTAGGGEADASAFVRNDANSILVNNVTVINADAWDNTDKVYGWVDNSGAFSTYVNGVAGGTGSYTQSALTTDRFGLGALVRAAITSYFASRVYAVVIVNRVLTASERAKLTTYLGNKAGLSL